MICNDNELSHKILFGSSENREIRGQTFILDLFSFLVISHSKLRVEIELRRAQLTGREFPTRTLSVCAAGS